MMSKLALLLIFCVAAVARVTATADVPASVVMATPASARPTTAAQAVDMAASELVAQRLRKIWPGEDVATMSQEVSDGSEDANQLMGRLNTKYGVYDRFNPVVDVGTPRAGLGLPRLPGKNAAAAAIALAAGATPVEEDYKTVYNAANRGAFDATVDNPETLDAMLGALWGKRYGHVAADARADAIRNENVIVMRATPVADERLSQGLSSDGSVGKFYATADDKAAVDAAVEAGKSLPLPKAPEAYKPQTQWYGSEVYGAALDVTDARLPNGTVARVPNDPPKPPTLSFVFPGDVKRNLTGSDEAPIVIIETIRVTKEGSESGIGMAEKPFTPIMGKPVFAPKRAPIIA